MTKRAVQTNLLGRTVKPRWLTHLKPPEPCAWFRAKDDENNVVPYPERAEIVAVWVEDGIVMVTILAQDGRTVTSLLEHYIVQDAERSVLKEVRSALNSLLQHGYGMTSKEIETAIRNLADNIDRVTGGGK